MHMHTHLYKTTEFMLLPALIKQSPREANTTHAHAMRCVWREEQNKTRRHTGVSTRPATRSLGKEERRGGRDGRGAVRATGAVGNLSIDWNGIAEAASSRKHIF